MDDPFPGLGYNWVAPAVRADGAPAVLKLGVPGDPALVREGAALARFDGRGAVRLLEADPGGGALLLERAVPGDRLTAVVEEGDDDGATLAAAAVMEELLAATAAPGPDETPSFPTPAGLVASLGRLRGSPGGGGGPLPDDVLARAEATASELLADRPEAGLLHGDLHHGNVLRATRRPWLAVDPRGVVAEPAWEAGSLLRNPIGRLRSLEPERITALTRRRVDVLAERLPLDRDRVLGWAFVQTVLGACWQVEDHGGGWERWMVVAAAIEAAGR